MLPTFLPSKTPSMIPTDAPSKSPVSSSPTMAPSVDCPVLKTEASCRVKGCAWISHLDSCENECTKEVGLDTIGESLADPLVLESIEKCEESCLESGLACARYTWNSQTSECKTYYT